MQSIGCIQDCFPVREVHGGMLRLRQKLESDPSHPSHVLTVHSLGYKFVP
jgi:two-component system alkaline phosphatase synthesis response regulator PhoP